MTIFYNRLGKLSFISLFSSVGFFIQSSDAQSQFVYDPNVNYRVSPAGSGMCESWSVKYGPSNRVNGILSITKSESDIGQQFKFMEQRDGTYVIFNTLLGSRNSIIKTPNNTQLFFSRGAENAYQSFAIEQSITAPHLVKIKTRDKKREFQFARPKEPHVGPKLHISNRGSVHSYWKIEPVVQVKSPPRTGAPDSLEFPVDPFYKKYIDADGLPILSSEEVPDAALHRARFTILSLLARIDGAGALLRRAKIRLALIGKNQVTSDIPEHSDLAGAVVPDGRIGPDGRPGTYDNTTRGLGATAGTKTVSAAEENIMCDYNDNYKGEDILVHEFAHVIHEFVLVALDTEFATKLTSAYNNAVASGKLINDYSGTNEKEYWAEGVQSWFGLNKDAQVNSPVELQNYDPALFGLLNKHFIRLPASCSCHKTY